VRKYVDAWIPPEASFLQVGTAKEAALRALAEALYQRRPVLYLKGHAQPYPAQVLLRTVRKPSVGALSTAAAAAGLFKSPSNTVIVIKFDPQFGYAGESHQQLSAGHLYLRQLSVAFAVCYSTYCQPGGSQCPSHAQLAAMQLLPAVALPVPFTTATTSHSLLSACCLPACTPGLQRTTNATLYPASQNPGPPAYPKTLPQTTTDIIVDPFFTDAFIQQPSTPTYSQLLSQLPRAFVGTAVELRRVVALLTQQSMRAYASKVRFCLVLLAAACSTLCSVCRTAPVVAALLVHATSACLSARAALC
jgi:hypothetical protein